MVFKNLIRNYLKFVVVNDLILILIVYKFFLYYFIVIN